MCTATRNSPSFVRIQAPPCQTERAAVEMKAIARQQCVFDLMFTSTLLIIAAPGQLTLGGSLLKQHSKKRMIYETISVPAPNKSLDRSAGQRVSQLTLSGAA